MPPPTLRLDPSRTTIEIRTAVEGALARVAHSLCLAATRVEGTATSGTIATSDLRIHVDGIVVRGVLKGESVDESVLSASDRRDIERRIREDVFRGATSLEIHADAANIRIRWTGGERTSPGTGQIEERPDGSWKSSGRTRLSLTALGIKPVYGPLRAFRVADSVEVRWSAVFVAG